MCILCKFTPEDVIYLTVYSSTKNMINKLLYNIKKLNMNEPFKYLGVELSSYGNQMHRFHKSTTIVNTGSRILVTNPFNRYQLYFYLYIHLIPNNYYPLLCSSLFLDQWKIINKAHIPTPLTVITCNRTWSLIMR